MKPRFSLKLLLIVVTAAALFCFWRTRPAAIADRFAACVETGQYAAADRLVRIRQPAPRYNAMYTETPDRFSDWRQQQPTLRVSVRRETQSPVDWLTGHCGGVIQVQLGWASGAANFVSTARGIEVSPFRCVATGPSIGPW